MVGAADAAACAQLTPSRDAKRLRVTAQQQEAMITISASKPPLVVGRYTQRADEQLSVRRGANGYAHRVVDESNTVSTPSDRMNSEGHPRSEGTSSDFGSKTLQPARELRPEQFQRPTARDLVLTVPEPTGLQHRDAQIHSLASPYVDGNVGVTAVE